MKLLENIKIDLLGCLKYMYKLSKEIRRRKIVLLSFSFALVSGLLYLFVERNPIMLFIFMFSASVLTYNIIYPIYMWVLSKFKA